jgi:hypothetical protein
LIGLCICFRQRALSAAEQTVIAHFQDMRRGDTNALLARYSPVFFHQWKESREQLSERLHARGLSNYQVAHREIKGTGRSGTTVWISCYSYYGSWGFNEDFTLYFARGETNFVVVRHDSIEGRAQRARRSHETPLQVEVAPTAGMRGH